jgi:hypothetical protein
VSAVKRGEQDEKLKLITKKIIMGYYSRDKDDQIYASLAYRLGKIATQYDKYVVEKKYEATLYISILQSLLTISNEYIRKMMGALKGIEKSKANAIFREEFESSQDFGSSEWGIASGCWVENTFKEKIHLQNFITRMRNAISHPNIIDITSPYPSSGFTTIDDDDTIIKKFCFVNSPDSRENQIKFFYSEEKVKKYIEQIKTRDNDLPENISHDFNGSEYYMTLNSKPFIRISKIELSVKELGNFVKHLANYFAQPKDGTWNGATITDLLKLAA